MREGVHVVIIDRDLGIITHWGTQRKTKNLHRSNPARRRQAGPGLRPGAVQPRRLAGLRRVRNSPLETRGPPRVSTQTNKTRQTVLSDGLSHERTLCAEYCASLGMRFFILVQLIFAEAKIKKRVSRSAERDSGLCPENPQPFEKGWRKLYFAHSFYSRSAREQG